MKIRIQTILLLIITIFAFETSTAQNTVEDVLYLKNGSILRGRIIEFIPEQHVKIQILGGSIFNYPSTEVLKITKESVFRDPSAPINEITEQNKYYSNEHYDRYHSSNYSTVKKKSEIVYKDSGSIYSVDFGFLPGTHPQWGGVSVGATLQFNYGYYLNKKNILGAGISIDGYPYASVVGLYTDYKHMLKERSKTQKFLYTNLGYGSTHLNVDDEVNTWGEGSYNYKGGLLAGAGFGLKLNTTSSTSLWLTVGVRSQSISFDRFSTSWSNPNSGLIIEHFNLNYLRTQFRIGFVF